MVNRLGHFFDHHRFQDPFSNDLNLGLDRRLPRSIVNLAKNLPELTIPVDQSLIPKESQPSQIDLQAAKLLESLKKLELKHQNNPLAIKKIKAAQESIKSREFHSWNRFLNNLEILVGSDKEVTCKAIIDKLRRVLSPSAHFKEIKINSIVDEEMYNAFLWWQSKDMSIFHSAISKSKIKIIKSKFNGLIHRIQGKLQDGFTPKASLEYLLLINNEFKGQIKKLKELKKRDEPLEEIIKLLKTIRSNRKLIQEIKENLGIDPRKGDEQKQIQKLRDKYQI